MPYRAVPALLLAALLAACGATTAAPGADLDASWTDVVGGDPGMSDVASDRPGEPGLAEPSPDLASGPDDAAAGDLPGDLLPEPLPEAGDVPEADSVPPPDASAEPEDGAAFAESPDDSAPGEPSDPAPEGVLEVLVDGAPEPSVDVAKELALPDVPPIPWTSWQDSFEWPVNPGWDATGLWHRISSDAVIVDIWAAPPYEYVQLAGPAALSAPKHGTHAFWFGSDLDGSYIGRAATGQAAGDGGESVDAPAGDLTSPGIDLGKCAAAELTFWSWWEIEAKHPAGFDLSTVEASADAGAGWVEVFRMNPGLDPPWGTATDALPYTVNGVATSPSWSKATVDLDAFAGGVILLRWRFQAGDVHFNGFRGWMVDQLSITCTQ